MEAITKKEIKMIRSYKKFKQQDIALYFFNKYKDELMDIIYSKINRKFSSIPFEKGDLFHLVWSSIKKTLSEFKTGNFNGILVNNCYILTLKEITKFLGNSEMVMNISSSYEKYVSQPGVLINKNLISGLNPTRQMVLDKLINDACEYIQLYPQPTIRRVIYLKSLGYSTSKIARMVRKSRYHIEHLLKMVEQMVKDMNC